MYGWKWDWQRGLCSFALPKCFRDELCVYFYPLIVFVGFVSLGQAISDHHITPLYINTYILSESEAVAEDISFYTMLTNTENKNQAMNVIAFLLVDRLR